MEKVRGPARHEELAYLKMAEDRSSLKRKLVIHAITILFLLVPCLVFAFWVGNWNMAALMTLLLAVYAPEVLKQYRQYRILGPRQPPRS
jgi:hypothetical protein